MKKLSFLSLIAASVFLFGTDAQWPVIDPWPIHKIRYGGPDCLREEEGNLRPVQVDCGLYDHCICDRQHPVCRWWMITCKVGYTFDPSVISIPHPGHDGSYIDPEYHFCKYDPNHTCAREMPQPYVRWLKSDFVPPVCLEPLPRWLFIPDYESNNCNSYYRCYEYGVDIHVSKYDCQEGYGIRFKEPFAEDHHPHLCYHGECQGSDK